MASLSSEFRDDLIENGGMHEDTVSRVIQNFEHIWHDEEPDEKMIYFLWEAFTFSLLLSLWWFSDKGKRNLENELKMQLSSVNDRDKNYRFIIAKNLTGTLGEIIQREVDQIKKAHHNEGQELQIVTSAIEQFLPEYNNLRVKRTPHPHMLIDKNEKPFDLEQLSEGEKNLIALVGDIARRMSLGNPRTNNPLLGSGIILIDEIDLHLHPSWQRLVVPKLLEVFPNCQFFISTHSPQILSHVKPDTVFLLEQNEEGLLYRKADETYGMSIDRVVELVMEDESRPESVTNDLENLFELIERKKLVQAKELVRALKKDMKTDPEIMRAEMLIRQQEMRK
jgi:predicted ATP-binding protein involved in virulence